MFEQFGQIFEDTVVVQSRQPAHGYRTSAHRQHQPELGAVFNADVAQPVVVPHLLVAMEEILVMDRDA